MSAERPYRFTHLLEVSKEISLKSDFIHFFHDLIHVYSSGQGHTAPRGQILDVNRNFLSFR